MAPRSKSRFWRRCRIYFRRFRISVLLVILALLGAVLYLNQIGLPGFIKKPLLEKLRARGVDLQFSRLRWRWDHGIVAENVRFNQSNDPASPQLTLKEVQVRLDHTALMKLQLQVTALVLRQGRLSMPIAATNEEPRDLVVDNIQTELHLLPQDLWQLDNFQARFAGANFQLTGLLKNASAVREWKFFQSRQPSPAALNQRRLRDLADALNKIHFTSPPDMRADFRGDARDFQSFRAMLKLEAPDAETPWGSFQHGGFVVQLSPATSNELSQAQIDLRADSAQTQWGTCSNLILGLHLFSTFAHTNSVQADLNLATDAVQTKWANAEKIHFTAQWSHSLTNPIPLSGHGELRVSNAESRWGKAKQLELSGTLLGQSTPSPEPDGSWDWWTKLAPYALDWKARLDQAEAPKWRADEIQCSGEWRSPDLSVPTVFVRLYGGGLNGAAHLNVATRQLDFTGASDFDIKQISALLTPRSQYWLTQYTWQTPPKLAAEGSLVLPAWTNHNPNWRYDVKPTVKLNGDFHLEQGTFRGVPADAADSHFIYSNETWRLPDLVVTRPEGRLNLVHEEHERTGDYYFRVDSTIDVRALRPLLTPDQQRGFDLIGFSKPPEINGEIWGRWSDPERTGLKANITLTDFAFRSEFANSLQTTLEYTNRILKLFGPKLERGTQQISANGLTVDFADWKTYVTNGFSTAEPLVVARAIGPRIGQHIEPYHFLQPPRVRVEGVIPMRNEADADLHFDVEGGAFEWWKFKVPRILGKVDWVGQKLKLRNLQAEFYGGSGVGNAEFDFEPDPTRFHFEAAVNESDLHPLAQDLTSKSNRLEGHLTARVTVLEGNSGDWRSLQGNGRVDLRDGLIWEIPIFGFLSPALNDIMPGLGSSRMKSGSASFVITNGVLHSDDLELRAAIMRLQYWGNVDLDGGVDARVQAELLRDAWVVGPVLSLALWPVSKVFEYKITGGIHDPQTEPLFFFPRLLLMPFHPLRTLKELAPEQQGSSHTNAPPRNGH